MKPMKIDGYDFQGPYVAGKDEIPAVSGIALIVTEAGEGAKILAIETADDLSQLSSSPRLPVWKENCYHGIVDVYVHEMAPPKRDSVAKSMIDKRASTLTCQIIEAIVDDW